MKDEPISWSVAFRVYWLILWRTVAMSFVALAPFNVWLMATDRLNDSDYFVARLVVANLLTVGAAFIAVWMALRKRYRGFKIRIVWGELSS
jgi:hypothetical protein